MRDIYGLLHKKSPLRLRVARGFLPNHNISGLGTSADMNLRLNG